MPDTQNDQRASSLGLPPAPASFSDSIPLKRYEVVEKLFRRPKPAAAGTECIDFAHGSRTLEGAFVSDPALIQQPGMT
jgi:hypothetical protein